MARKFQNRHHCMLSSICGGLPCWRWLAGCTLCLPYIFACVLDPSQEFPVLGCDCQLGFLTWAVGAFNSDPLAA